MSERVLVTGASGFVGMAVLERLCRDGGRSIVAAMRAPLRMTLPARVQVLQVGNLDETTVWRAGLAGVTTVVHCAARTHVTRGDDAHSLAEYRRVNVDGTLALARQAVGAGVRRFVFLSSIKVNGESTWPGERFHAGDQPRPEDAYGISKLEAERGLLALSASTGLEVTIIRPPLVYGPGVKGNLAVVMHWISKGVPLPFGALKHNRRSLVALDNLVDLVVTCLDHPLAANQVFLVRDGEDLSTTELFERVAHAMQHPSRLVPVPSRVLSLTAIMLGRREVARRLCGSLQVDMSKTQDILGWTPLVTVDEGLRQMAAADPRRLRQC